jgi:hypothetical protein
MGAIGAGGGQNEKHLALHLEVMNWCRFEQKQEYGADYDVAIVWQKNMAVKLMALGCEKTSAAFGRAHIEMRWPGSATRFNLVLAEEDRQSAAQMAAEAGRVLHEEDCRMRGQRVGRVVPEASPSLKRKMETARTVRAGLDAAIEGCAAADGLKPNVWFGEPFLIKVGKPAAGAPDARPTESIRFLGRINAEGAAEWDEDTISEVFGEDMSGKKIMRQGMERNRF